MRGKKQVCLVLHAQTATFTGRFRLHGALILNAGAHARLDVWQDPLIVPCYPPLWQYTTQLLIKRTKK